MKNKIIQNIGVILLFLLITFGVSYKVLPSNGVITYNDAAYFFNLKTSLSEIITTFSSNYFGLDQSNNFFLFFSKGIFILFFDLLRVSKEWISYITSFGLLFVCSLSYFYVFKSISKNFYYGVLAGVFIVLNNLSMEHIAFGGLFYYYLGNIAFVLLIFRMWKMYQEQRISWRNVFVLVLSSLLIIHPFYFVIYVIFLFLFVVFMFFKTKLYLDTVVKSLAVYAGVLSINMYWLVLFLHGSLSGNASAIYNPTNLKSLFEGFAKVASPMNAANLFQYFNFFSKNFHQTVFHYLFYIGIVFAMIAVFVFWKKHKYKVFLLFLLITYLVIFNLALGPVSRIIGEVWTYLWNNVSFFSFFRSFSRFLITLVPLYLFYFAIFNLDWKYKYKNQVYGICTILIIFLHIMMFTGDLGGNVLATKVPREYTKANQIVTQEGVANSIIAYPNISYEAYEWGMNKDVSLMQQNYYLKDHLFDQAVVYNRASLNLHTKNDIFSKIFSTPPDPFLIEYLRKANIRYILVQKDLLNIFSMKPVAYEDFYAYFYKNAKEVENNKYYALFDLQYTDPVVYSNGLKFQKVNGAKYHLTLTGIESSQDLYFLKSYYKDWKLYLKPKPTDSWCKAMLYYRAKDTIECAHASEIFKLKDLSYLWTKPAFEDSHMPYQEYLNMWTLDSEYIKKTYSSEYYKENPEGGIDVELVLYFKPQSYLYLGLLVSGIALIGTLYYFVYVFVTNKKRVLLKNHPNLSKA